MTVEESTVLISLLSLSDKIKINDVNIDTEVNNINSISSLSEKYNPFIAETVSKIIDSSKIENYEIIVNVINSLDALTGKQTLLGILDAKNVDYSSKQSMSDFVDKALLSNIDDFQYFSIVVRIAIFLGDSIRIKSAIDKIQSLGV